MFKQNKTIENSQDVRSFIDTVVNEKRREDAFKILSMMEELLPDSPKMWGNSIVGFGNYHYKYKSGREGDFFKVGFSPRKHNMTIYVMPGFDRYDDLMDQLGKHTTGKSCLYIKKLEDIDSSVLRSLIKDSYDYMTTKYG